MNEVYLLTGGNMGDRPDYLERARAAVSAAVGPVRAASSVYETAAWGLEDQPSFYNQVLCVDTELSAEDVLHAVLAIEQSLGRMRDVKYGPRTIDIDILFFNDAVIDHPALVVPHPQMAFRRFVLAPLNELAPDKLHPVLKKTVGELLAACPDKLAVHKIS